MIESAFETFHRSCEEECSQLNSLPKEHRKRIVEFIHDRTVHYVDMGYRDPSSIYDLVEAETKKKFDFVILTAILLAVLTAVIQFIVLKILRRIWPDRLTEFM